MWPSLLFVGIRVLAAIAAAWGIWRRKWYACVPAVLVGLALLTPAPLAEPIIARLTAFVSHVEPRSLVMVWLLVDAAAVGCLVALWAGWSRAPWFWRLSALAGVPAALSLVKANEPIALAFVVMPVIAAAAWWVRRWCDRQAAVNDHANPNQRRLRWQIRDALLLFVPVGLVALAIRSLVAGPFYINWEHFAALAAGLVLLGLTAAAAGGATTSLWRWLSAAACVGLIAAVTAVFITRDNDVLGLAYFFEQPYIGDVGSGLFLMAIVGIPVTIGVVTGIYRWSARQNSRSPKAILFIASAAITVPLVVVGVMMLPPAMTVERLPPSPTYERLIATGERIRPLVPVGRPSAKLKPEIDAVAKILEQPGHVWFDVEEFAGHELSRQYDTSFDALYHIVYSLEVETARAEARGDYSKSARLGELQLRLSRVMSKGGMMIHWGISHHAELRGRAAIDHATEHLDAGELERLLAVIQEHERSRVTVDSMLAYHDYWNWQAFGWRERFFQAARKLARNRYFWLTLDKDRLQRMRQTELAGGRLIAARLAIELYLREHGELPQSLDQLVPEQLPKVPLDPWTDRPLIYRRDGGSFVLYSTWSDRQDNGGRFLTDMNQATDFGSDVGYDLDPGFDRRGNPWPRNDPTVMGTVPAAPVPTPPSRTPASN